MRGIKFRGKRVDNGGWVYGYYFKTPLTDENSGVPVGCGWCFLSDNIIRHCISTQNGSAYVVDPETVGQFTGLKDSNGKEIYEGDVVETELDDRKFVVTWDKDQVMYLLDSPELTSYLARDIVGDIEIKGNIYENPELLH